MTSLIGRMQALTYLQAGSADAQSATVLNAAGTGSVLNSISLKGAVRAIVLCGYEDEGPDALLETWDAATPAAKTGVAEGVLTFETSYDGGTNWGTASVVRFIDWNDSKYDAVSTVKQTQFPCVLKIDHIDGDVLLRARITTGFSQGIVVQAVAVGK